MLFKRGPVTIKPFLSGNVCDKVTLGTSRGDKTVSVARDVLLPISPFLQSIVSSVSPCLPVTIILSDVPGDTLDTLEAVMTNPGNHFEMLLNYKQLKHCDDLFSMLKLDPNFFKISPRDKETFEESFAEDMVGGFENIEEDGVVVKSEMLILSCQFCHEEGFQQNDLLAHLKTHTKELSGEDIVLKCPSNGCQKTFEYFNSFGRKLDRKRQLKVMEDHLRSKHTKLSVFMCDQCGKGFYSKMSQKYHIKQHSDHSRFYCEACDHFVLKDLQANHLASCEEKKTVTGQCSVCGKYFKSEGNLQMHKLIHSSKKPFKCDQCDKEFSQKGNLKTHKIRKH